MTNPLSAGLRIRPAPQPCALVIFGATGDLTRRKLVPALCNLAHEGQLPANFAVIGFARRPKTDAEFRAELREGARQFSRFQPLNPAVWETFAGAIQYHQADFNDPDGYRRLTERLARVDRERGTAARRLFYLATAPSDFPVIIEQLGAHGLGRGAPTRLIVEKPFGSSLATARQLNATLAAHFDETQIYRMDHYLGKETVQNILALRFANEIFEPLWNAKYVDHVQITVAESLGVEGRGAYYDATGALRDMVQNHIMQLLALTALEPPAGLDAEDIRDEKVKVLRSIRPLVPAQVGHNSVRGQYSAGSLAGRDVPGYLQEPNVAPHSHTETFVALKLHIDNWRWAGVPFFLRHGKRLPKQIAEIAIQFKAPPAVLFATETTAPLQPNVLVLRIQPDEGISIRMNAKVPGTTLHLQPVKMDFRYGGSFGARAPEAYERLLHDALAGDSTLFTRNDEVECSWALMDTLRTGWETAGPPHPYEAGTWGPAEADAFIAKDGRTWRRP